MSDSRKLSYAAMWLNDLRLIAAWLDVVKARGDVAVYLVHDNRRLYENR